MSSPRTDAIVTPEAVSIAVDVAGLGSRLIATIIDSAIQVGLFFGLTYSLAAIETAGATGGSGDTALVVLYLIGVFVVFLGYYPLFEGFWNGRTPGKRAQGLRVVLTDGQPVTVGPVLVRNLVRIVDFLPAYYMVGAITMILSRRSQRLGDLAAGTIVVRERALPAPRPLALRLDPERAELAARMDTTGLGEREYGLIRSFLERRGSLDDAARVSLAHQLAEGFRRRTSLPSAPAGDEAFLEALAQAYRGRHGAAAPGGAGSPPSLPPPPP